MFHKVSFYCIITVEICVIESSSSTDTCYQTIELPSFYIAYPGGKLLASLFICEKRKLQLAQVED